MKLSVMLEQLSSGMLRSMEIFFSDIDFFIAARIADLIWQNVKK